MQEKDAVTNESPGIHRRTIVKGAAWSLPVIAVAVAAPAATASTTSCVDTPEDASFVNIAWNDYANGSNAIGSHNGSHLYGPNTPLFTDLRLVNNGPSTIASWQSAFTVQTAATNVDPNNVVMSAILPDGTEVPYSAIDEYAVVDNAPERRRFTFSFYNLVVLPGQIVIFRTKYLTAPTTNGNPQVAQPFGVAQPTSILCNGQIIPSSALTHPDNLSDNGGQVTNPYWVQGA